MASPRSPRTGSPARIRVKTDYKVDAMGFREHCKLLKSVIRNHSELTKSWLSGSSKLSLKDSNKLISEICDHVDMMAKQFVASAGKRKVRENKVRSQPKNVFFISDQLVNFIMESNLGNGMAPVFTSVGENGKYRFEEDTRKQWSRADGSEPKTKQAIAKAISEMDGGWKAASKILGFPATEKDIDIKDMLRPLIEQNRMANSSILVAIFPMITYAEELSSKTNGQRRHYSQVMERYMGNGSNLHYVYNGNDLTQFLKGKSRQAAFRNAFVALKGDQYSLWENHTAISEKSAFDFFASLPPVFSIRKDGPESELNQKTGKKVSGVRSPAFVYERDARDDDWGLHQRLYMRIAQLFRIPEEFINAARTLGITGRIPNVDSLRSSVVDGKEQNQMIVVAQSISQRLKGFKNSRKIVTDLEKQEME